MVVILRQKKAWWLLGGQHSPEPPPEANLGLGLGLEVTQAGPVGPGQHDCPPHPRLTLCPPSPLLPGGPPSFLFTWQALTHPLKPTLNSAPPALWPSPLRSWPLSPLQLLLSLQDHDKPWPCLSPGPAQPRSTCLPRPGQGRHTLRPGRTDCPECYPHLLPSLSGP